MTTGPAAATDSVERAARAAHARGRRWAPAVYIGVNLLVDVLYAYLNPRSRYSL